MQFSFQVHGETLVSVTSGLQSATNFAYFHVAVLLDLRAITQCLKLCFLLLEFLDFFHDGLRLLNVTLFTELFCILVEELDLCLQLVNLLIDILLLASVHLRLVMNVCSRVISALRSVLCSGQTALDLGVHLSDHLCQLKDELVLILALVAFAVRICHELLLEEIIVAFLARSNVCLRVREQVVRAEGQQVEFANLRHNKNEINNVS